jgi:hypothetical protein
VRAALPTETYTPMELKVSAMEKHTVWGLQHPTV